MDQAHQIWNTAAVRAAAASGDPGAVIRAVRRARNLTLAELAARINYSPATVSRLERGKQHLTDVHLLRTFADALGMPPHLLGLADTSPETMHPPRTVAIVGLNSADEETYMRRRTLLTGLTGLAGTAALGGPPSPPAVTDPLRALEHVLLNPPTNGTPAMLPQLHSAYTSARATFDLGRYRDVAATLPDLLTTAIATHATGRGSEDIADRSTALARVYILASQLTVKLGRDQLAWTSADRAVQHSSDHLLTQASAHRAWAIVLRRTGHAETAGQLILNTATTLQRNANRGPQYLALSGSLLATAAYTAAVDGDRDTAHTLLAEAQAAATALDQHAGQPTGFGSAVGLYKVSIARVLGDAGAAVDAARRIDPAQIPAAERRARYWSDVARAFDQWGKPEQCYRALLAAERAAPDEVRYHKPILAITRDLLHNPVARSLPGLQRFAHRTGAQ